MTWAAVGALPVIAQRKDPSPSEGPYGPFVSLVMSLGPQPVEIVMTVDEAEQLQIALGKAIGAAFEAAEAANACPELARAPAGGRA